MGSAEAGTLKVPSRKWWESVCLWGLSESVLYFCVLILTESHRKVNNSHSVCHKGELLAEIYVKNEWKVTKRKAEETNKTYRDAAGFRLGHPGSVPVDGGWWKANWPSLVWFAFRHQRGIKTLESYTLMVKEYLIWFACLASACAALINRSKLQYCNL